MKELERDQLLRVLGGDGDGEIREPLDPDAAHEAAHVIQQK